MSLSIKTEKVSQSNDLKSIYIKETTGVYNSTTNPTGLGASQTPTNKREIADIIKIIEQITYGSDDTEYNIIIDGSSTPTLSDYVNQLANLVLDGADVGGTTADEFTDGVYVFKHNMFFDDMKISNLTESGLNATASATTGGTLASGNYEISIAALDGGNNTTNAISTDSSSVALTVTVTNPATNAIDISWGTITNAVKYRVYINLGGTKKYVDVAATSYNLTDFTGLANTWTSLPASNTTKGYVKYTSSGTKFTSQGISATSFSTQDYPTANVILINGSVFTIATNTVNDITVNEDTSSFTNGNYYEAYIGYQNNGRILIDGNSDKCLVKYIAKISDPCCNDCMDANLLTAIKMYMTKLSAENLFNSGAYSDAERNLLWLNSICTDTGNPCDGCD